MIYTTNRDSKALTRAQNSAVAFLKQIINVEYKTTKLSVYTLDKTETKTQRLDMFSTSSK